MVTCNLYGRMGNQMFQIAATIGYAVKHSLEYHIPDHTKNDSVWPPVFKNLTNPNFFERSIYTIKEREHCYQELEYRSIYNIKHNHNIVLDGYFQSYRYFEHCFDKVKEAFGFKFSPIERVCSVHVRRGDYLKYPDLHPVVTEKYINQAIDRIIGKTEKLIFFSDDISWCRQYAASMPFKIDYEFSEGNEIEDFQKMMCCEFNIISNSTFSLWAAMLNDNPKKTVISPSTKTWFGKGNSHLSTDDIIPPYFIQI